MIEPTLRDKDFLAISRYVQDNYGIVLKEEKKDLVKTRLSKLVRDRENSNYGEYLDFVKTREGETERVKMIDAITTNLTSFYRESKHFDFLRGQMLPKLAKQHRGKKFKLRGWCTAASSGEEPYTIAMEVVEFLQHVAGCDFKLLATDICTKMLERCEHGVYEISQTEDIPREFLGKHFQKGRGKAMGKVKVKDSLRRHIQFSYLNLVKPFPISKPFDFIFCRNVMIYFDQPTQQKIVDRFCALLKPGGHLFMGMSEGLSGIQHTLQFVSPSVYRKA